MATLTITTPEGGYYPSYSYTPALAEFLNFEYEKPSHKTPTSMRIELDAGFYGVTVEILGTGFTYDTTPGSASVGDPIAGTITTINVTYDNNPPATQTLTGLDVSVVAFLDQARAHQANPLITQLWLMSGNDTLDAAAGRGSQLYGGYGDDSFIAGTRGAFMQGGAGKDTYKAGNGFDTIAFDDAFLDPFAARGAVVNLGTRAISDPWGNAETFTGTVEVLRGSQFGDRFTGTSAAEQFVGLGGRDVIDGGGGFDLARYDLDEAFGGAGRITVDLASGVAKDGFGQQDTLRNIEGVHGTKGADTLRGTSAANVLHGFDGDDFLDGRAGIDELDGGEGDDTYVIDNGRDKVVDSLGVDTVRSTISVVLEDTDRFQGRIENVVLLGTAANASGNLVDNVMTGNAGNNYFTGLSGNDTLHGREGNDRLSGGDGDDLLFGGDGGDVFIGGRGFDMASYFDATGSVVASMTTPGKNTGFAAGDIYSSVEMLVGSRYTDTLEGNSTANVIDGGNGRDILTGGAGADTFRFASNLTGDRDTITDFTPGVDTIELASTIFNALSPGALDGSTFTAGTSGTPTSSENHLVYETDTGRLRYYGYGSDSSFNSLFAVLTPNLALTYEDFFVT